MHSGPLCSISCGVSKSHWPDKTSGLEQDCQLYTKENIFNLDLESGNWHSCINKVILKFSHLLIMVSPKNGTKELRKWALSSN